MKYVMEAAAVKFPYLHRSSFHFGIDMTSVHVWVQVHPKDNRVWCIQNTIRPNAGRNLVSIFVLFCMSRADTERYTGWGIGSETYILCTYY